MPFITTKANKREKTRGNRQRLSKCICIRRLDDRLADGPLNTSSQHLVATPTTSEFFHTSRLQNTTTKVSREGGHTAQPKTS